MAEDDNWVQLQIADGRNATADGPRFSQLGDGNFSNVESAINHLKYNPELREGFKVFRIVDARGAVVMLDSAIRGQVHHEP
jgi:hypothetical protein